MLDCPNEIGVFVATKAMHLDKVMGQTRNVYQDCKHLIHFALQKSLKLPTRPFNQLGNVILFDINVIAEKLQQKGCSTD